MLVATPPRMKMDGSWIIVQTPTFYENKIIESSLKDANIHPPPSMGEKINPTISPDRALPKNFFNYMERQGGRLSMFTLSIDISLDPR